MKTKLANPLSALASTGAAFQYLWKIHNAPQKKREPWKQALKFTLF